MPLTKCGLCFPALLRPTLYWKIVTQSLLTLVSGLYVWSPLVSVVSGYSIILLCIIVIRSVSLGPELLLILLLNLFTPHAVQSRPQLVGYCFSISVYHNSVNCILCHEEGDYVLNYEFSFR